MTLTNYGRIRIAGGDTARPANLGKRMRVILEALSSDDDRVLDAGCGAGEYVAALHARGIDAVGLEFIPEKVRQWRALHPGDERVIEGDIAAMPYPAGSFDLVIMNEVIEHVPDEQRALAEVARVLRPGGRLLIMAPNRRYPFETHGVDTRAGRRISPGRTFGLPWMPLRLTVRLARPWARNYWPRELRGLVERQGFAVKRHTYLWQTLENISGRQPAFVRRVAPALRAFFRQAERVPGLRTFGVSQVMLAERGDVRSAVNARCGTGATR